MKRLCNSEGAKITLDEACISLSEYIDSCKRLHISESRYSSGYFKSSTPVDSSDAVDDKVHRATSSPVLH